MLLRVIAYYWSVIKGDSVLLGCLVVLEVLGNVTGVLGVVVSAFICYWGRLGAWLLLGGGGVGGYLPFRFCDR